MKLDRSELKQQAKSLLRNNWWMGAFYSLAGFVIAFVCVVVCGFLVAYCAHFITLFFSGDSTNASAIALAVGALLGMLLGAIISFYFMLHLYIISSLLFTNISYYSLVLFSNDLKYFLY